MEMPPHIRKEISKRLLREMHSGIDHSLNPGNY
jgi:hypothetical protein